MNRLVCVDGNGCGGESGQRDRLFPEGRENGQRVVTRTPIPTVVHMQWYWMGTIDE